MQEAGYQIPTKFAATEFLEKILSRKCKVHQNLPCEYIHLKPSEYSPRLCAECMEERSIPFNEAISIRLLMKATSNTTFKSYPKFADNSINQKILDLKNSDERISTDLSSFFDQLNSAVSQAIEKTKLEQKKNLCSLSNTYQDIFVYLNQISKIDQFKEFVNTTNENEHKLREFLQSQYSQINIYTETMNNKILEYQTIQQSFSLSDANSKLQQIINLIEGITLFSSKASNSQEQQSHFQQQNLIKQSFQQNKQLVQQQSRQLQQQQEQPQQKLKEEGQKKQQLREQGQQKQQIISTSQTDYDQYHQLFCQVQKKYSNNNSSSSYCNYCYCYNNNYCCYNCYNNNPFCKKYKYKYDQTTWQEIDENERQDCISNFKKYLNITN